MSDEIRLRKIILSAGILVTAAEENQLSDPSYCLQLIELYIRAQYSNDMVVTIEIDQWINVGVTNSIDMTKLNDYLIDKSYLVRNKFTIADVSVFWAIYDSFDGIISTAINAAHVQRWYNHIEKLVKKNYSNISSKWSSKPCNLLIKAQPSNTSPPATLKIEENLSSNIVASKETKKSVETGAKANIQVEKKSESAPKIAQESAPLPNKETSSTTSSTDLDPSKLEIKVGYVVKCWENPNSDKLLCEEIDLGESSGVRTIASGLRPHYAASDLQGQRVLVMSNLKERNMGGFKSQGMVLCAVEKDHSMVKLVQPPASANIGDRVTYEGFTGEPFSSSQVTKKKVLETVGPFFHTDSEGVVRWKESKLLIGGETCFAPLFDAVVS